MIPQQQAPIVLTAMTLRGIGSYLHGARLEIKPLTVLCGKNGSGKSTWLKTLDLLDRSQKAGLLPWRYDIADREADNIQVTNAFYHAASPEALEKDDDQQSREEFGPPTTIGLEMVVARDYELSDDEDESTLTNHGGGKIRDLFWNGICRKGTRLRLRIAHPSYWSEEVKTPTLFHLIELAIDDKFIVRLKGERDPSEGLDQDTRRPIRSKLYQLYCSPSIIPGETLSKRKPIHLASVTDLPDLKCESAVENINSDVATDIVATLEQRFEQIISEVLSGFFYIGAVRESHNYLSLDELDDEGDTSIIWRRHVGVSGKHSWILERNLDRERMRNGGDLKFSGRDFVETPHELASQHFRSTYPKMSRIYDLVDSELKSLLTEAFSERNDVLRGHCEAYGEFSDTEFTELNVQLLNRLLDEPQLFDFSTWYKYDENFEARDPNEVGDPEIAYLVELGPQNLSPRQLRRLNYLLIEDAFWECLEERPVFISGETYGLGNYVSNWMSQLTDTELTDTRGNPRQSLHAASKLVEPTGLLLGREELDGYYGAETNEIRCTHPCFGLGWRLPQPPRQLSAGFHQIFPIIVQLGLMRSGELVGIENPEVHLHPALQLRLTEALIKHVDSGRRMIIETHSDLVIRRVIRAILEEQIAQSQVQVYFTELRESETARNQKPDVAFHSSNLSRIRIDERGRIANWPEGFLDEDVRESQRLLDIMYGGSDEEDEDD